MSNDDPAREMPQPYSWRVHAAVPAVVGGASAWLFHWIQYYTHASLTPWAVGGGAVAGGLLGLGLWARLRARRVAKVAMCIYAFVLPVAVGVLLLIVDPVVYGSAPERFPDWAAIALWGACAGLLVAAPAQVIVGHGTRSWWDRGPALAILMLTMILVAVPGRWMVQPADPTRYPESCRGNLSQIGLVLAMYAEDFDGCLPPPVPFGELAGAHSPRRGALRDTGRDFTPDLEPREGGLADYDKCDHLWFCPQDPDLRDRLHRPRRTYLCDPGSSYEWNAGLASKRVSDIPNPDMVPLIFDRGPFHGGTRNVVFVDGHVGEVSEDKWEALEIEAR